MELSDGLGALFTCHVKSEAIRSSLSIVPKKHNGSEMSWQRSRKTSNSHVFVTNLAVSYPSIFIVMEFMTQDEEIRNPIAGPRDKR